MEPYYNEREKIFNHEYTHTTGECLYCGVSFEHIHTKGSNPKEFVIAKGESMPNDTCGAMLLTPSPEHNGGMWGAEKKPCKVHPVSNDTVREEFYNMLQPHPETEDKHLFHPKKNAKFIADWWLERTVSRALLKKKLWSMRKSFVEGKDIYALCGECGWNDALDSIISWLDEQ